MKLFRRKKKEPPTSAGPSLSELEAKLEAEHHLAARQQGRRPSSVFTRCGVCGLETPEGFSLCLECWLNRGSHSWSHDEELEGLLMSIHAPHAPDADESVSADESISEDDLEYVRRSVLGEEA